MNNNENYARFFAFFSIFILILFFGYKYYEYKTIKDFISFQNIAEGKEYRLNEKDGSFTEKSVPLINNFWGIGDTAPTTKKTKLSDKDLLTEKYNQASEVISLLKVSLDSAKEYEQLLIDNKQIYLDYKNKLPLSLNPNVKLLKQFIDYQLNYYKDETASNTSGEITNAFYQNYYQVLQERMAIDSLNKTFTGKSKKYYADNYNMFATLEKYTRSDFKFYNDELIKENKPYGYEWLDKNKKYFAAYYELIKEYTYGDQDSYNYKYEKFNTLSSDFNIDMSRVVNEGDEERVDRAKRIVKSLFDRYLTGKKINAGDFKSLPLIKLGKIGLLKIELAMCQSFQYRYGIYKEIMNKYLTSKSVDELVSDFDNVNLSNKEADNLFDKKLLTFTDSKEKAVFECVEPVGGEKFRFVTNK